MKWLLGERSMTRRCNENGVGGEREESPKQAKVRRSEETRRETKMRGGGTERRKRETRSMSLQSPPPGSGCVCPLGRRRRNDVPLDHVADRTCSAHVGGRLGVGRCPCFRVGAARDGHVSERGVLRVEPSVPGVDRRASQVGGGRAGDEQVRRRCSAVGRGGAVGGMNGGCTHGPGRVMGVPVFVN